MMIFGFTARRQMCDILSNISDLHGMLPGVVIHFLSVDRISHDKFLVILQSHWSLQGPSQIILTCYEHLRQKTYHFSHFRY